MSVSRSPLHLVVAGEIQQVCGLNSEELKFLLLLCSVMSLMWKSGHLDAAAENRAGSVGPLHSMSSAFSPRMTDTCFNVSEHHGIHTRICITIFVGALIDVTCIQVIVN